MSWGAMMGLGQGLQQVGGMISDNYKEKMRNQLELEREERQEERAKARELWKRSQFSGQYEIDDATGRKYKLDMDHNRIDEGVPLTEREIREREQADSLAKLTLLGKQQDVEKGGLDLTIKRADAENAGNMSALERQLAELKLTTERERAASLSRGNRGNTGNSASDTAPTQAQAAKLLTSEYKTLIDSYVGTAKEPGNLTRAEVEEIAMEVVRAAAIQRKDPSVMFRDELAKRAARNKDPKSINFR